MNTEALIVVDYQNDFASPEGALYVSGGETIAPEIARMIAETKARSGTVIATFDSHPKNHVSFASTFGLPPFSMKDGKMKWPDHCVTGSWGEKTYLAKGGVDPHDYDERVMKGVLEHRDSYSGFGGRTSDPMDRPLREILEKSRVRIVRVVGLALDYCVGATALDAQKFGYDTEIILSATRSVNPESEKAMMARLTEAGVKLTK